jgi:hypothetical protein
MGDITKTVVLNARKHHIVSISTPVKYLRVAFKGIQLKYYRRYSSCLQLGYMRHVRNNSILEDLQLEGNTKY